MSSRLPPVLNFSPGADRRPATAEGRGAVYDFQYDADTDCRVSQGQLQAPAIDEQAAFGSNVLLSDGMAFVGVPGLLVGTGVVVAFALVEGSGNSHRCSRRSRRGARRGFGSSITFDGETARVGAPGSQGRGPDAGAAMPRPRRVISMEIAISTSSSESARGR